MVMLGNWYMGLLNPFFLKKQGQPLIRKCGVAKSSWMLNPLKRGKDHRHMRMIPDTPFRTLAPLFFILITFKNLIWNLKNNAEDFALSPRPCIMLTLISPPRTSSSHNQTSCHYKAHFHKNEESNIGPLSFKLGYLQDYITHTAFCSFPAPATHPSIHLLCAYSLSLWFPCMECYIIGTDSHLSERWRSPGRVCKAEEGWGKREREGTEERVPRLRAGTDRQQGAAAALGSRRISLHCDFKYQSPHPPLKKTPAEPLNKQPNISQKKWSTASSWCRKPGWPNRLRGTMIWPLQWNR